MPPDGRSAQATCNRHSPWPVASFVGATGHLLMAVARHPIISNSSHGNNLKSINEEQMVQTLDVVDWFLLAGSLVYFALLVLRRI